VLKVLSNPNFSSSLDSTFDFFLKSIFKNKLLLVDIHVEHQPPNKSGCDIRDIHKVRKT
jgi:hypothetical protein